MSGKPLIVRPTTIRLSIPEDLRVKLDLFLVSPTEGRIPRGAYKEFFAERLREFFRRPENRIEIQTR